jgi:hypothetical protein
VTTKKKAAKKSAKKKAVSRKRKAALPNCSACDRPEICDSILPGSAPCGKNRGCSADKIIAPGISETNAPLPEPALPECNEKELAFIAELMKKPGNGSAAMIAAGITDKPDVAKVYASQYLDRPQVLAELERRRARLMDKLDISLERVLEEIRRIALANVTDVVTVRGAGFEEVEKNGKIAKVHYHGELDFKDLDEMPEEVTAAIAGVSIVPGEFGTKREIRMHPKLDALKTLLEHLAPSKAEKDQNAGGKGGGSMIIIEGGPTGLEVTVKAV